MIRLTEKYQFEKRSINVIACSYDAYHGLHFIKRSVLSNYLFVINLLIIHLGRHAQTNVKKSL